MGSALSLHPAYQPLKQAVRKNDVASIRAMLGGVESLAEKTKLAHRAARWAFDADALESFEALLTPTMGFKPYKEITSGGKAILQYMIGRAGLKGNGSSRFSTFLSVVIRAGLPLHHNNYENDAPLFFANRFNQLSVMRDLLEAGADPNSKSPASDNPLLICCSSVEAVRLLLEFGVDLGAAPKTISGTLTGGMCFLLHKWPREEELPALLDAYLAHNGTFVTPMEGVGGEKVPLGVTIMFRPVGRFRSNSMDISDEIKEIIRKAEDAEQTRRHLLQDLLVSRGLNLNAPSPYRFPWKEFIPEHGSERLKRLLGLEQALPSPVEKPSKPRF